MPNEKRQSFLQSLCKQLSPWIVFVHRVLSGNCKAVDKYDKYHVRSDDTGFGDNIKGDDVGINTLDPNSTNSPGYDFCSQIDSIFLSRK